jgi:hypothetical protein
MGAQIQSAIGGVTYVVGQVPYPAQLISAWTSGRNTSNTPHVSLWVHRFTPGSGFTSIVMGSTVALPEFGTSGGVTFNVAAAGVTYALQAGDQLVAYVQPAATSTVSQLSVSFVVEALQDIKTAYGIGA